MKVRLFVTLLPSLFAMSLLAFQIPLIESSEVHDVAVTDVTISPTWILINGIVTIKATVENQGTSPETFNVTIYADNHTLTIWPLTVSDLPPEQNKTLTFKWELFLYRIMIFPPPWPPNEPLVENLTVRVKANAVSGEVNISDNVYIDGTVTIVWWPPDVNGDGRIDIRDIAAVAKYFGGSNPMVDFNSDGKIDIRDIATSARFFGMTYGAL